MTFFGVCAIVIAFISYRCWFFRKRPAKPVLPCASKRYEEFENIAVKMIEMSPGSRRDRRDRVDQFYRDFPHPDDRERLKRVLR